MALSFDGAIELPHFDKPSFRFNGKIFSTLWTHENKAMLKLPLVEQSVYCDMPKSAFEPVPGAWGAKGATFVDLTSVQKKLLREALKVAYDGVAKPKSRNSL